MHAKYYTSKPPQASKEKLENYTLWTCQPDNTLTCTTLDFLCQVPIIFYTPVKFTIYLHEKKKNTKEWNFEWNFVSFHGKRDFL